MNLIQRIKAPTPKKFKSWGKTFKWLSGSLVAGMLAVNSVSLSLSQNFNTIIAGIIFVTGAASTACYAQVKEGENDVKN